MSFLLGHYIPKDILRKYVNMELDIFLFEKQRKYSRIEMSKDI